MKFVFPVVLLLAVNSSAQSLFDLAKESWAKSRAGSVSEIVRMFEGKPMTCEIVTRVFPNNWHDVTGVMEYRMVGDDDTGRAGHLVMSDMKITLSTQQRLRTAKL